MKPTPELLNTLMRHADALLVNRDLTEQFGHDYPEAHSLFLMGAAGQGGFGADCAISRIPPHPPI